MTSTTTAAPAIPTTEAEIAAAFAPKALFSLGCMYSIIIIDTFFAGIMTMQVYSYWMYQRGDTWWIKGVVIAASCTNIAMSVWCWYVDQYLFVAHFGLWAPFAETGKYAWFPFIDSINSGIIQCFFTWRAYRLCGRRIIIPIVCGILVATSIGCTIGILVIFLQAESLFQATLLQPPELTWLACTMCCDIIITVCILYGLIKAKTGWSNTDRTITRLIRMTLESQAPPTIIAIAFMIDFVKQPSSLFGAVLQGIQCKFYGMGLMYALNARITFKQQWNEDNGTVGGQVFALSNRPTQKTIQIEIATDTYVTHETAVPQADPVGLNRNPYEYDDDKQKETESLAESHTDNPKYGSQARLTGA